VLVVLVVLVLVVLVIFLFLRSLRATLIPFVTIPVSLIGAFFLIWIMGFSINVLTLLGIVLAVGLVVDDAIVVLENIHRHIEDGMTPVEAIQAATVVAAEALGRNDVGVLEAGRFADIVAVQGDPAADVTLLEAIPVVIKGGEVVKDRRTH
jgi:Cu/Ag efflux pump CusA